MNKERLQKVINLLNHEIKVYENRIKQIQNYKRVSIIDWQDKIILDTELKTLRAKIKTNQEEIKQKQEQE